MKKGVKKESSGLGDTIKKITNAIGIETCDDCEKRRIFLNKLFPYTKHTNEMLDEEIDFIKSIKNNEIFNNDDIRKLYSIYNRVFKERLKYSLCASCIITLREKLWQNYITNHSKNIDEE